MLKLQFFIGVSRTEVRYANFSVFRPDSSNSVHLVAMKLFTCVFIIFQLNFGMIRIFANRTDNYDNQVSRSMLDIWPNKNIYLNFIFNNTGELGSRSKANPMPSPRKHIARKFYLQIQEAQSIASIIFH